MSDETIPREWPNDADYRSFDTMAEYRQWCEENLPEGLGYKR